MGVAEGVMSCSWEGWREGWRCMSCSSQVLVFLLEQVRIKSMLGILWGHHENWI